MLRHLRWGALATASLLSLVGPARAQDQRDCAPVVDALRRLGDAVQYRWTVRATTPGRRRPLEREQIVIGDTVFMTPDQGRWMREHIPTAERAQRMEVELARTPPESCHADGEDTRDGTKLSIFAYRQGAGTKRIWIGADDGLPHDFTSDEPPVTVTMHVSYADVTSPLP